MCVRGVQFSINLARAIKARLREREISFKISLAYPSPSFRSLSPLRDILKKYSTVEVLSEKTASGPNRGDNVTKSTKQRIRTIGRRERKSIAADEARPVD